MPKLVKVNMSLCSHTGAWGQRTQWKRAGNPRHKQNLGVKENFPKITIVEEPERPFV